MKIGIQTWGSNGDIRPMMALAEGLQQAGHQVTLVVTSVDNHSYREICAQIGIAYRQIPDTIHFDMQDFARRSLRMHALQWLRALLDTAYFPHEAAIYRAAQQLAHENDYLIGHHFLYPLKLAAKLQDKPFFSITLCHGAIVNPAFPAFKLPNFGRRFNRLTWALRDQAFSWAMAKPLTALWLQAGLKPPANLLSDLLCSQALNLVAVDPWFCPASDHWQAHHQLCGFLHLSADANHWTPPSGLTAFLAQGAAPVYMTFGSLQQATPEWSMDLFVQAAQLAGCRAIIQTSSSRYPAETQQGNLYFIGRHPHQPVFAQCQAVVHHGGAGTTHAATRAACVSVVVPFMSEQLFWAQTLQSLGLAAQPLPAGQATPARLAKILRHALDSKKLHANAKQAGQQMQTNNGVAQAIALLESKFKARPAQ